MASRNKPLGKHYEKQKEVTSKDTREDVVIDENTEEEKREEEKREEEKIIEKKKSSTVEPQTATDQGSTTLIWSLIKRYKDIASPNVMITEKTKQEAPPLLYRILVTLDQLYVNDPSEAKLVEDYIDKNTIDKGQPKVFNSIYITRKGYDYDFLSESERSTLFTLIKKYIKD